jgi:hypothetical protein
MQKPLPLELVSVVKYNNKPRQHVFSIHHDVPNLAEPPKTKLSFGLDLSEDQAEKSKSGQEATFARTSEHMDLLQSHDALKQLAWH